MAYEIIMTRGTTSLQQIRMMLDEEPYFLDEGEFIHFGVKESHDSTRMLIDKKFTAKDQDSDGFIDFAIDPEETQKWPCKTYKYDIGLQSERDYYIVIPESDFIVRPNITSYEVIKWLQEILQKALMFLW